MLAVEVRGWRGLGHGQSHAVSASYLYCDYRSLSFFRSKCHGVVLSMAVQTLLMRQKRYQYMKYHTGTTIQRSRKAGERNGSRLFNARDHWTPTEQSCICSQHFTPDYFIYESATGGTLKTPRLKSDEVGVTAFPTVFSAPEKSERAKRLERRTYVSTELHVSSSYNYLLCPSY